MYSKSEPLLKIPSFTVTGTITSFYCCSRFSGVGYLSRMVLLTRICQVCTFKSFITIKSSVTSSSIAGKF